MFETLGIPDHKGVPDRCNPYERDVPMATVRQIQRDADALLDKWMRNADKVETAIDNIGDVRRWPRFCLLLTVAMMSAGENAALSEIRELLRDALEEDAINEVTQ